MKVQSYCRECGRVQNFEIVKNIGPALVPMFYQRNPPAPCLYTSETATGYEVRGLCPVEHLDEDGKRIAKWMVIARWRAQGISRPRWAEGKGAL